ncbi:MAG: ketoacyl-ACP synthase III [Deltaproteobacteria bacterium]|nr:ketoacyl-ACP synthase III [Deltaproteobacteria bacterium]
MRSRIIGTGSATPEKILTNKELEGLVETSDEWIRKRTGIEERHISMKDKDESTTALATEASLKAMDMAGVAPEDIDMIIVATVTPDRQFPAASCMIQKELRAQNAAAFDISAGCSGFIYGLSIVDNAIKCGAVKKVLVVGVERLSSILNWKDRGTCVLLGDGAGAVVLEATEKDEGILSTHIRSDGTFWDLLHTSYGNDYLPEILEGIDQKPFHMIMEGNKVFKIAVNCLASIAREALEYNNLSDKDISILIQHQANLRIISATAKSLDIPMERVYTNVQKYGNTSSASIPIALDEITRAGKLKRGDNILLDAFGAGFTWGASIIKWALA